MLVCIAQSTSCLSNLSYINVVTKTEPCYILIIIYYTHIIIIHTLLLHTIGSRDCIDYSRTRDY